MTRCTKALIQYVYEEYDINRIEIRMSTKNKKSRAIPIRLGFTQEGILRSDERVQGNSQIVMCIVCLEKNMMINSIVNTHSNLSSRRFYNYF